MQLIEVRAEARSSMPFRYGRGRRKWRIERSTRDRALLRRDDRVEAAHAQRAASDLDDSGRSIEQSARSAEDQDVLSRRAQGKAVTSGNPVRVDPQILADEERLHAAQHSRAPRQGTGRPLAGTGIAATGDSF